MFKFIHAADIHLDSPPRGLLQYAGAPAESLRDVTRRAFEKLVQLALDERVAFVLIAGDLYDGDWKDFNTGLFLVRQLAKLCEAGIGVYIVLGNHDAESNLTRSLPLPEGVRIFPARPTKPTVLEELGVALHGRSFKERDTVENLVPSYGEPIAGAFNIGLLHTAIEGSSQHAHYAPCSLDELKNKGYAYWALGHVHMAQVLSRKPYIVFSGNLQGRHIRETGAKGAALITVEDGAVTRFEHIPLDVLRWKHLEVDVKDAVSRSAVEDLVREAMASALRLEAHGRPLAMRVTVAVRGASRAHAEILSREEAFRADLRALAANLGSDVALIEKIRIETLPAPTQALAAGGREAADELRRMLTEAATDAELLAQLKDDLSDLLTRLPAELRAELEPGPLSWLKEGRLDEVVRDAAPLLLARLSPEAV